MACEALIRAIANPSGRMQPGYVCVVRDLPWSWGSMEGLPGWWRLQITDANASEVDHWASVWETRYVYNVQVDNPAILQVRFEVDPDVISATGNGRNELKAEAQAFVEILWNATVVTITPAQMIVNFTQPAPTIQEIGDAFTNVFYTEFDTVTRYFSDADVDAAIAAGGLLVRTMAQANAMILNKLDE